MRKFLIAAALALVALPAFASTLYLTEFAYNPGGVTYQAVLAPAVANQTVSISGVSAQSNAFNSRTVIVRIQCDVICSVNIGGTNPTATSSSMRLAANQTEYFIVKPGDKLAVITNN